MELKKNNEIKYIDLFGGVGGFRLGIERAFDNQYESKKSKQTNSKSRREWDTNKQGNCICTSDNTPLCVFYNDNDKYAVQTYNKNFKENWKPKDIREIRSEDIPEFEMLCAGFPCQAFSIAGKRKGFEDTRGTLFYEICRIIKSHRPKIIFLENVKGLLSHDRGRTFAVILSSLDELGYNVEWQVLNSKFFGVPQNRERVFIVGHLRGESSKKIFPIRQNAEEVSGLSEGEIKKIGKIPSPNFNNFNIFDKDGISPTIPSVAYKQAPLPHVIEDE